MKNKKRKLKPSQAKEGKQYYYKCNEDTLQQQYSQIMLSTTSVVSKGKLAQVLAMPHLLMSTV